MWFVGAVRLTFDGNGTPGVSAPDDATLFFGLGLLHGRFRPLQSMLIAAAGTGRLSELIAPKSELVRLDAMAHRLDLVRRGERAADRLSEWSGVFVDRYLAGLSEGLGEIQPFELRVLFSSLPKPDRASMISGFLLSAYLGLAEGQERMERAVVEALGHGANEGLLRAMFQPHLEGWEPNSAFAGSPPLGFAAHGLTASTGSNAWAVDPSRSRSGASVLAGDPHLMINQLPSLFFEVRLETPDNYWLGVTVPGLPGMAICRTRHIAYSGTFAVADNVDHFEVKARASVDRRTVDIQRRLRSPLSLEFLDSRDGTLEAEPPALASRWAGVVDPHDAIDAYLRLMFAKSADEGVKILERAHTLSLHFVIADRGTVRYRQNGCIPKRTGGWSGLYPVPADGPRKWDGFYTGAALPVSGPVDGMVLTANEARLAPDGGVLSTLAQPLYRFERIRTLLAARHDHDVRTFQQIQLDLTSLQAARLRPYFLSALDDGPLRRALVDWDLRFNVESRGASAFRLVYRFALSGLAPELGGCWFEDMVGDSELTVWWATALDRVLSAPVSWTGARGRRLAEALRSIAHVFPDPLGVHQSVTHKNLILGGLGLGFDHGPHPLPGSLGTICQGTKMSISGGEVVVAPAYRFVTDMSEDAIYSTLPGGIHGSRFDPTYSCWIDDHHHGRFHKTTI